VTKLETSGWGGWSSALPYVSLPETYNGNQLTSYGGHIRYKLAPHFTTYGPDTSIPDIIIKVTSLTKYISHYHQPINAPTAGTQVFFTD
jgi:hypothetical protein